jgi:hypothetical protein
MKVWIVEYDQIEEYDYVAETNKTVTLRGATPSSGYGGRVLKDSYKWQHRYHHTREGAVEELRTNLQARIRDAQQKLDELESKPEQNGGE